MHKSVSSLEDDESGYIEAKALLFDKYKSPYIRAFATVNPTPTDKFWILAKRIKGNKIQINLTLHSNNENIILKNGIPTFINAHKVFSGHLIFPVESMRCPKNMEVTFEEI